MRRIDVGRSGSVEVALGRAAAARQAVRSGAELVVAHTRIVGAERCVLGRHQPLGRPEALRRETGGPPWRLAEGAELVRIALAHASVLLPTPPDKLLNRNVRPLLGAIRRGGPLAMYGGRDFVAAGGEIVALLAWARGEAGEVVLDVALPAPDGTLLDPGPSAGRPWYLGKRARTHADPALAARIAEAYAPSGEAIEFAPAPLPPAPWSVAHRPARWQPVEIGAAGAVIERDDGRIARAGVVGDFFADDALDALGPALGAALARGDRDGLVRAFGTVGIEGVREPAETFTRLLLEAASEPAAGAEHGGDRGDHR
jgi:hypothetical protein